MSLWCNGWHTCLEYGRSWIIICCFSTIQAVLRSKSKDWLAQDQDNLCGATCLYM